MAKGKTEVAVVQDKPLAFIGTDQEAVLGTGRGSEGVRVEDMVLPRLEIVQSESPIKDEHEDAREGMLFNSVTRELYGTEQYLVPVSFRLEYIVWKDQDKGGGFLGAFPTMAEAEDRVHRAVEEDDEDQDDLEIVDTPVHYCLRVYQTEEGKVKTEQIVVAMSKSKAKVSRKWNTMIQLGGGDRFSRVYKITTFKDQNRNGKTFQNYDVRSVGPVTPELHKIALAAYEAFTSGSVRVAHETARGEESNGKQDQRGEI